MSFTRKYGWVICGLLTAATSCGGVKGKSGQVKIEITPSNPIVITADSGVASAPWFVFQVKITNNSDAALEIVALTLEYEITDSNGELVSGDTSFSAQEMGTRYSTTTATCAYDNLGVFQPGDSYYLYHNNTTTSTTCPNGTSSPITFQPYGLASSDDIKTFRYRVKLIPNGWFTNSDGSQDRFTGTKIFVTR